MNHRTNISFDFDNGIRFDLNQLEFWAWLWFPSKSFADDFELIPNRQIKFAAADDSGIYSIAYGINQLFKYRRSK